MADTDDTKRQKMMGGTAMPKGIRDAAKKAGATVEKCPGEELYTIRLKYGSDAWNVIEKWVSSLSEDADPAVVAIWAPSPNIFNSSICPPLAQSGPILNEANSIINHYAPLVSANFQPNPTPVIAPPLMPAGAPTHVHHAKMALVKLHGRIQNPAQANYPVLTALNTGSYICDVMTTWANVVQVIALYKA